LETEQNFIQMIKTVESIGRCVILLDEIEKYLNTGATSGAGDSGTGSRSFGTLLSWMSDRTSPAFIIFTSNNHLALPVELIRKGRTDELFWCDLPGPEERKDIFTVVIQKYGRVVKDFDIDALVKASDGFTGSEIDNLFKDAMFNAFAQGQEVNGKHLITEIADLTPQSVINEEAIDAMRSKVKGKLRPAAQYDYSRLAASAGEEKLRKLKA
jgi:SpoVK/Ycf46/Vps4 family AAA+-type ATPase